MIEKYTLILRHEAVHGQDRVQLDPPLCLTYSFDRLFGGTPILLNRMMDEFKDELIRRTNEGKGVMQNEE